MRNFRLSLFSYSDHGSMVKYDPDAFSGSGIKDERLVQASKLIDGMKFQGNKAITEEASQESVASLDEILEDMSNENEKVKRDLFGALEEALNDPKIMKWDHDKLVKLKEKWQESYKAAEEKKDVQKKAITAQRTKEGKSLSDETFKNLFPDAKFSDDELKYALGDQDIKRAIGRALTGEKWEDTSADLGNLFSDTDKELAEKIHTYLKAHPESQAAFLSYIGKDTNIVPFFGTDDAEQNTASIKQLHQKTKKPFEKDNKGTVKYEKAEGKLQIDTKKNSQLNALIGGEDEREGIWGDVVNPTVLASVMAGRDLQTVYRHIT